MMLKKYLAPIIGTILGLMIHLATLCAQSSGGTLRGQITDPTGAVVPALTVTLTDATGSTKEVQTDEEGKYVFNGLPAGTYSVQIHLKGFADFEKAGVVVAPGKPAVVNAQLEVYLEKQQVNVSVAATDLSVSQENNSGSLTIRGNDLQSLADDPDELAADLQALAGPAAGPNGGQIYVDGFTGGQLPPKSAILNVRVNQNPFSAEYDKLGYGRVEITTKPAAAQLHGLLWVAGNSSVLNSRNPFTTQQVGGHSEYVEGNLGDHLGNRASYFVTGYVRNANYTSAVSAIVLDPNLMPSPFSQALAQPQSRKFLAPRVDYRLSSNNVLTVRYEFWHNSQSNLGVGEFSLPSQAYNVHGTYQALQTSDTQVVSSRTVNQTRFRYWHYTEANTSASPLPTTVVIGAFTGGGNVVGTNSDTQNNYEFQNLTSITSGNHIVSFGGRLRDLAEVNRSTSDFNGTFTFSSINAYRITAQGLQQGWTPAQIRAAGGGASQFSIASGQPAARLNLADLGLYAEDQWRPHPRVSLSFGLRFETQNHISDHADFAPRLGLAWAPGGQNPKTVLRAGAGIFYDRFQQAQLLHAIRLNGINQEQSVVFSPDFYPVIPPLTTLAASQTLPTLYRIDHSLTAPYTIQAAVGVERKITRNATVSVTYLNSHGVHQLLTRNINTPLPGTFDPTVPTSGVRPFGEAGNILQFESDGLFNQSQVITNFNLRMSKKVSMYGYYTLNYADSNTGGPESSPMNPYDLYQDYGRAAFDVRHRLLMGGSFALPHGFGISPFVMANSGSPFNVTLGQDLLGTSFFNDRPSLAPPGATGPGIIATSLGTFDTMPNAGSPIPPYFGTGPGQFVLNLRLVKTFGLGRKSRRGGGPIGGGWFTPEAQGLGGRGLSGSAGSGGGEAQEPRYNIEVGITARNIFNVVNLGTPVGNLTSPIFGRSNSLAPGPYSSLGVPRRLDVQIRFTF